ncbi:MAG: biotin--[acetyl-CoA-carboxylase] ligase [Candidatus Sericytochromatia bacterium]|nr:biotin--[acetyl-CoA-carboxylase] ligase [Candidatus Tanganyikabacteria bacterium]
MQLIHLPEVDSTSAYLAGPAGAGLVPWTVVLADRQTGGRGQHGRAWVSPAGGLYASILLGPEVVSPVFTLLAGVAVAEGCEAAGATGVGLKWVNDLVYAGRKLGGILAEVVHRRRAILGIGLNLAPVAVPEAAWLEEATGGPVDRLALLEGIVARLAAGLQRRERGGQQAVLEAWAARSVTLGRDVRVESGGEILIGRATGLDEDGRLVLELPGGLLRPVASGTVRLADGRYA